MVRKMGWDSDWIVIAYEFTQFEWDHEKARSNLHKHGIDFQDATRIFRQDVISRSETVEGEERTTAIGAHGLQELAVVFTERGDACRLISARRATPSERRWYRSHLGG